MARLVSAAPAVFPSAVWRHALSRIRVPELPSRAVELYWRAHPLRADQLARALASRSSEPAGWTWRIDREGADGIPESFRTPPAPYREKRFSRGAGFCCVCGQPVFRFGWHKDLWNEGSVNGRAAWHSACVAAWRFWNAPSGHTRLLKRVQSHRCAETGRRLLREAEVDHRTPLFKVWRERRDTPWPELLGFWGRPNLQVINRDVHVQKCAAEAGDRAALRCRAAVSVETGQRI